MTQRLTKSSGYSGSIFHSVLEIHTLAERLILRLLGTPTEEVWPGVSSFPDYKPTFPQWSRKDVGEAVPQLDPDGLDLVKQLLAYDTVKRISGESLLTGGLWKGVLTGVPSQARTDSPVF